MAILWTRAETPSGVIIDLNSAASDELGRPGVSGEIDNHFWDRFGAAIMLSLLNDTSAFMIAREQNNGTGSNNTTIAFPNTVNGTQNIVGDVLKQTIDIPPTLTKTGRKHQYLRCPRPGLPQRVRLEGKALMTGEKSTLEIHLEPLRPFLTIQRTTKSSSITRL